MKKTKIKIEVGDMTAEKFKKTYINTAAGTPDLDCGIYLNGNELFLPINKRSGAAHYMHVIPNSHFWTDLKQITYSIEIELSRQKREAELKLEKNTTNSVYIGEPLTRDYILIGLGNSLMRGYKLKQNENIKLNSKHSLVQFVVFKSIEDMIEYAQSKRFNLKSFSSIISNTINIGFNLTNGIKMERKEVYKRLDAERKYQDIVGESGQRGNTPDEEKPVAEWVNYIEYHLSKAKDYVYHLRKDNALEELRKVAALAVRAMEIHGCPERRMPTRIGNISINSDGTTTTHTNNE